MKKKPKYFPTFLLFVILPSCAFYYFLFTYPIITTMLVLFIAAIVLFRIGLRAAYAIDRDFSGPTEYELRGDFRSEKQRRIDSGK